MLNKIENISANSSYKEKPTAASNLKEGNSAVHFHTTVTDSFSSSSAVKYLNLLKWKLKQFKLYTNGMVEIEFSIGDFSFFTKLFGPDYYSEVVEYRIQNENTLVPSNIKYEINLNFEYFKGSLSDLMESAELVYLKLLYNRIASFEDINEYMSSSSIISPIFFEGMTRELVKELSDIHKKLLFFLEKVTGNPQLPSSQGLSKELGIEAPKISFLGIQVFSEPSIK
ncbi:MAG: hypothetical protein HXY50_05185 [Ignavibacteriaceae bacterium]|nr:hypothetical protein [Ignavibacteriaceae bacterium]